MYYDDYSFDENYYNEPSKADNTLDEAKEKFK